MQSKFDRYLDSAAPLLTPTPSITARPIGGIDENVTPLGTFTRFVDLMNVAALSLLIGLVMICRRRCRSQCAASAILWRFGSVGCLKSNAAALLCRRPASNSENR